MTRSNWNSLLLAAFGMVSAGSLKLSAEQVIISEVMYHPAGLLPEFIEVRNLTATPFDIADWEFTDGVTYEFPAFTLRDPQAAFLKAYERILVSPVDEAALRTAYPAIPAGIRIFGPWSGSLDNDGERITLQDKNGVVMSSVKYSDGRKWPVAPDGTGHSLTVKNPNRVGDDWRNWRASTGNRGSPGAAPASPGAASLALSEVAFDPVLDTVDWVEIFNGGGTTASLSGLFVASATDFSDKVALTGSIAAGGYRSIDVSSAFTAGSGGELQLFVIDSGDKVLTAALINRPDPGRNLVATYPAGSGEWFTSSTGSRDAANDPDRCEDIVINEVMYDAPSDHRNGEFIELYNRGASTVDLSGWKIVDGVGFTFPGGTTIASGAYLVVCADADWAMATYGAIPVIGDFSGQLSDSGELIRIEDSWGNLADQVDYMSGGDWPDLADGDGSSMELRHPEMDNDSPSAWVDSDESQKSTMQNFSFTDTFLQNNTSGGVGKVVFSPSDYKELHLHLVGDAHLVLENVSVRKNGSGPNLVTNGTTLATDGSSASGWLCMGTHWASFMDSGRLHLVSDGHGDNKANLAEIDIPGISDNDHVTVEFDARWVSGKPRLIVQTWDHSVGKTFLIPIPEDLGTPGGANSTLVAHAAPEIGGVIHSPAVPTASQDVTITARVGSSAPLGSVNVLHRLDNTNASAAWASTAMADDGSTGGDQIAGDGIYTATLNQYKADNKIVQFYVEATTTSGASTTLPKLGPARPAMWLVDNSTITGDLHTERFVISAYDMDAIGQNGHSAKFNFAFPIPSNHYFNCTFISDESEVFYNAEIRKGGSVFLRDIGNSLKQFKWKLPEDRLFRGRIKTVIDPDPNSSSIRHHDRVVRYLLYLLGHPVSENEFVKVVINGGSPVLRQDVEPVANDFLKRNFDRGSDGILLRNDDEWWFKDFDYADFEEFKQQRDWRGPTWNYLNEAEPTRYHTPWGMRSRETDYNYSDFVQFVKKVDSSKSTTTVTESEMERMVDNNLACMLAAGRGYIDDRDCFLVQNRKNLYFYRKPDGRWMFLHWDSDRSFERATRAVTDSQTRHYFNQPYVRRYLNYHLTELVDKHTKDSARTSAWLDAEEDASTSFTVDESRYLNWFASREASIISQIGDPYTEVFNVTTGTAPTTADTISLAGTSPSSVFDIRVVGHPDARATWTGTSTWTLPGLHLANGFNSFTIQGIDHLGKVVEAFIFTITKTGNAAPVMQLASDPASFNLSVAETLALDASAGFDPEGGALTFAWTVSPTANVNLSASGPQASATFSRPGLYEFTVTGTDDQPQSVPVAREAAVYNESDFSSFADPGLEAHWQLVNLDYRDNSSPSAWCSTEIDPGTLQFQVLDDSAKPFSGTSHPILWRDLPDSTDWSLHTNLKIRSGEFGDYHTGLIVETDENGTTCRYGFGIEDGDSIVVKCLTGAGVSTLAAIGWSESDAKLRIRRAGNQLHFEQRHAGVWTSLHIRILPAGTTVTDGGIFTATDTANPVRTDFDYLLLVDPGSTSDLLQALRITELMYHPANSESLEFIELVNTGPTSLDLAGVSFDDGDPFTAFTFAGGAALAPGEHAVLAVSPTAFVAEYGAGPRILGQWLAGALSNGGERIVLRDPLGNAIHDFSYDDDGLLGWPVTPDGAGPSLEVIDTAGDYNDPANWRASSLLGGSPGTGVDSDGDGLSDLAEAALGTNPNTPDSDGDGSPDGTEVAAGTDPLDPSSAFRISSLDINPASTEVMVTWGSGPGRTYTLQFSPDLAPGSWQDVATGIPSQGTSTSHPDTKLPPGTTRRFYRVVADSH